MPRARWSRRARSRWPRSSSRARPTSTRRPARLGARREGDRPEGGRLMPTFTTELLQSGNNVGIVIPDAVVAELGGKRVPVVVTLDGGYSYRNTTAVMGGLNLVGLSAEHRAASGFGGGDDRRGHHRAGRRPARGRGAGGAGRRPRGRPGRRGGLGASSPTATARSTPARSPRRRPTTPAPAASRRRSRCCAARPDPPAPEPVARAPRERGRPGVDDGALRVGARRPAGGPSHPGDAGAAASTRAG